MSDDERKQMAKMITDLLPAPKEIEEDWGLLIADTVMPYGVWTRPGLPVRDRSLATISALTVLHMPNELRIHIGRGLENGLTKQEIAEAIMHMAIYGGFPAAVEAMNIAREVFEADDPEAWMKRDE